MTLFEVKRGLHVTLLHAVTLAICNIYKHASTSKSSLCSLYHCNWAMLRQNTLFWDTSYMSTSMWTQCRHDTLSIMYNCGDRSPQQSFVEMNGAWCICVGVGKGEGGRWGRRSEGWRDKSKKWTKWELCSLCSSQCWLWWAKVTSWRCRLAMCVSAILLKSISYWRSETVRCTGQRGKGTAGWGGRGIMLEHSMDGTGVLTRQCESENLAELTAVQACVASPTPIVHFVP